MTIDQRRTSGRREGDATINIPVPSELSADSPEVRQAVAEVNSGHKVVLSPEILSASGAVQPRGERGSRIHGTLLTEDKDSFGSAPISAYFQKSKHAGINSTDLVTALSGGAAMGIVTLAFAPASVIAAAAAAVVGVGLAGAARRFDRNQVDALLDD